MFKERLWLWHFRKKLKDFGYNILGRNEIRDFGYDMLETYKLKNFGCEILRRNEQVFLNMKCFQF